MIKPVRPEDVLPDGVDKTLFEGVSVRKGTVKAFLENIEIFENPNIDENEKQAALAVMKDLAPALIALRLNQHVTFKNTEIEKIIKEAADFLLTP